MSKGTGCPETAEIKQHTRSQLAPESAACLDRHLAACRPCLDEYLELDRKPLAPEVPGCHIVREIGRGRFGVVYKAWSLTKTPRIVALKILTCPGDMEQSRFDREIAVLKRIDSPGIVKCLDSGTAGDAMYYLMDYVEGVHLDEYLAQSTDELNDKLAVFELVCRAVADAHDQGVVHRDLKPRNILIDSSGRPHILDFGICALEAEDWSSGALGTITHPGDVIGTLRYMSPEQAWGGVAGPADERSDIWALGIMLYEIVTGGDYPYSVAGTAEKPAHEALLERIRNELPQMSRLDYLPRGRDLEVLLERCLAWEPERRIDSAAKLADDLGRYRHGRRTRTKPLQLPYRIKRLAVGAAARSRWMFSAVYVAALGVALTVAAYVFNIGWHVRAHDPPAPHATPTAAAGFEGNGRTVAVVGVSDETASQVVEFANEVGIPGVSAGVPTWRAVHGHLMERLALAGPRAVVWDYYFTPAQPGDRSLVSGMAKLEEAGVPVVLAALTYDEDGTPDLSPTIREAVAGRLRHGAIIARDMTQRPGEFVIAIKRSDRTLVPSLALSTLGALLHPDTRLDLEWPGSRPELSLLYELAPGAFLRGRDRIELTSVFTARRNEFTARAGDQLGCSTFPLHRTEHWRQRTYRYERLLTCSDDDLRALAENKVLVFGDTRTARFGFSLDRHRVRYGLSTVEDVPGCYLLADAIVGLLDGRYVRSAFPLAPRTLLVMLLLGVLGCVIPVRLARGTLVHERGRRRVLWTAVLGLSAACFLAMIVSKDAAVVHLSMAGFSLLAPMAGSLWVELARNRHRILDSRRRAVDGLDLQTAGTVTLAAKRWRSPLRAQG